MSDKSFGWTSVESFNTKMSFSEDDNSFMNELEFTKIKNFDHKSSNEWSDGNDIQLEKKNDNKRTIKLEATDSEESKVKVKKKKKRKLEPAFSDNSELEGKSFKEKLHKKIKIEGDETGNIDHELNCSMSDDLIIHDNKKAKKKKHKRTEKLEDSNEDLVPTVSIKKEKKNKNKKLLQESGVVNTDEMSNNLDEIKNEETFSDLNEKKKHKSTNKTVEENATNSLPLDSEELKSRKRKNVKKESPDQDEIYNHDDDNCIQNPNESFNNLKIKKNMSCVDSRDSSPISETKTRKLIRKNSFHYESPNEDKIIQDRNSSPQNEFTTKKLIRKNSIHYNSSDIDKPVKKSLSNLNNEIDNTILSSSDEENVQISNELQNKYKSNKEHAMTNQQLNNVEKHSKQISKNKSPTLIREDNKQKKTHSKSLIDTSDSSSDDNQESLKNEHLQIASKKTKTSSISDKIRFESEPNDYGSDCFQGKLKAVLDNHENLKRVKPSSELTSVNPEIDDIWIMKCPSSIDISNLRGLKLPIEEKTKFKIDNQRYECFMDASDRKNLTIMTPNPVENGTYQLQTFPCLGEIKLRNKFPKLPIDESIQIVNKHLFIPLPDTKRRHPLFGIEYKPLIKLNKDVKEKLKTASKKIKSKKKIKREEQIDDDNQTEKHKRKKLKRKLSSDEDIHHKLNIKKQKKKLSDVMWNSEKAMEENLFANY